MEEPAVAVRRRRGERHARRTLRLGALGSLGEGSKDAVLPSAEEAFHAPTYPEQWTKAESQKENP